MLSEQELVKSTDDVLLVFWVIVIQMFDQFSLYKSLLVESLLVLQNFESNVHFFLVIICSEYHTEGPFTDFLVNFISVAKMLV